MKQILVILCLMCVSLLGVTSSSELGNTSKERDIEQQDLEGSETSAKLFSLGSLFPSYGTYPSYRPNVYPTYGYNPTTSTATGGGYYPSSGYYPTSSGYPTSGYYPAGTNILGAGYDRYPSQTYYPYSTYSRANSNAGYRTNAGYGGYGGYRGNGGLRSYYGYDAPTYSGTRNRGFGYYSDTDRYGFYQSPSEDLYVNRGYD